MVTLVERHDEYMELMHVVYFSDASHATSGIGFFNGATIAVTNIAAV